MLEIFHWPVPAELQLPGNLGHLEAQIAGGSSLWIPSRTHGTPWPHLLWLGWGAALHGLPREPGGTGKEMKTQVQPWEHSFWGLVFSNCHTLTLPHNLPDESTKIQSWAWALCWHTIGVLIILIFWRKISFSLEKCCEGLEMQISTSFISYLMSFHGTAVPLSEMYHHTLRKKTYCQSLLILWNYIKILEITLALMTGLFVYFPFESWEKSEVDWLFSSSIV